MSATPTYGILPLMRRLWNHLSPRRRRQFLLILILMVASAFLEVVSLGMVVPFLGVLTAPEKIFNNPWVADYAHAWGISSGRELIFPLTMGFVLAILFAGGTRLLLL